MFERLFFGLIGLSSDIIQADSKGRLALMPDYGGSNDVQLVDELLELGTTYKYLSQFIDEIKEKNPYTLGTGMYIRALADGLSEVLCEYRKCVVQFEDYFLSHPMATLSELRNDLSEWFPVFLALRSRIYRVHIERMHGCHLLRYMFGEMRACGQENVCKRLSVLVARLNDVLFDQLTSWLLYGILKDPHTEFFIRPTQDGVEVVDDFVPLYLSEHATIVKQVGGIVAKFNERGYFERSIYGEKEAEYANALQAARTDLDSLATVLASLNAFTSDHLWEQLVVRHRLEYHLDALLNTVFMGRGDLFLQWIDKVQPQFVLPFEDSHLTLAAECLKNCFYQAYPDEDAEFIERIHFVTSKGNVDCVNTDTWAILMLVYDLPSDLHCLLSLRELRSLGYAFQMLLAVRRAEIALNSTLGSKVTAQAMKLRYEMDFFVSNFESYLHMDVLHVSFGKLKKVLHGSQRSIDTLRKALAAFVQDIAQMVFVSLPKFKETLLKMFQTCIRFPLYINGDLRTIEQEFRSQQDILRRCFNVLQDHAAAQQAEKRNECIMRFLYRLDYNPQYQQTRKEMKALREKLRNSSASASKEQVSDGRIP
ncbi:gamma-tubulin complex component 4-like [Varroa destructor]|uniref:Gamma-tubulin complex component n=1 Tax=Varroa destructor TaxID=109461 RepID=A0A7M7IX18_VARDE|nr:gamma-tubulin complex component 4-like [Varroa destructor]